VDSHQQPVVLVAVGQGGTVAQKQFMQVVQVQQVKDTQEVLVLTTTEHLQGLITVAVVVVALGLWDMGVLIVTNKAAAAKEWLQTLAVA
jgi:hypothetical protein